MFIELLLFILGFIILIKGADILVDGSSSIAKHFGVSAFFIGLTVVAFGTSTPELAVSVIAGIDGNAGIALGNILGSNISNTLLILGLSAAITPLAVKKTTINKEIPFSLLAIVAVGILVNDFLIDGITPNGLTRIDGLILILFFIIFAYYTFGISREKENIFRKTIGDKKMDPTEHKLIVSIVMIIVGLVGLILGGKWIVEGAISLAGFFGMSETIVALSVIAIGTSLPEIAASGMAAYKGRTDIAVGNVIGSNIFNLLWVLGLSAIIRPIGFSVDLNIDIIILFVITIVLLFLVYLGKKNILGRIEGLVLIFLYIIYLVFLLLR